MPRPYQIIPQNSFPTEEVYINDNTVVTSQPVVQADDNASFLLVVSSPKGTDGKIQTINGLSEFNEKIGLGPFSLYGQPLITAYKLAETGKATLHLLRVAADDATYASIHLCAKYKVGDDNKMQIKFYTVPSTTPLLSLDGLEDAYSASAEPDDDGFSEVKLLSVASNGKGLYGNSYNFNINTLSQPDRENAFKNYSFNLYSDENGVHSMKESYHICFSEEALIGTITYFADSVIMSPTSGSERIKFVSYPENFIQIVAAYNTAQATAAQAAGTDFTPMSPDDFDYFFGKTKSKTDIPDYEILTEGKIEGVDMSLLGGSDGALDSAIPATQRENTLKILYEKAWNGDIDPMIKSKNKYPTTIVVDANYDCKGLIHKCNEERTDSVAIFGAKISDLRNKTQVAAAVSAYGFGSAYESIDAYAGNIRDPYNQKVITVTSTYALALLYANDFFSNGGAKHIPVADRAEGNLDQIFIPGSIFPVYDEDIDANDMNDLIDARINFARYNALGRTNRSTQTTCQPKLSALSELNNVFIIKDIKRMCERMCATNRYNFADPDDLAKFNTRANMGLSAFGGQVRSINATVGQSAYEKDYSIVHLYIDLVNRALNKSTIIEIDVNKG